MQIELFVLETNRNSTRAGESLFDGKVLGG